MRAARIVPDDEAITGAVGIEFASAALAESHAFGAGATTQATAADGIQSFGEAVRVAHARIAGVNDGEFAEAIKASSRAARVEDAAFLIRLAALVAALAETTFIARLTVNDCLNTDAVDATVVYARIVVLLAAAIAIGLTRAPAVTIDAGFAVKTPAGVLSTSVSREQSAGQEHAEGSYTSTGDAPGQVYRQPVELLRIHCVQICL